VSAIDYEQLAMQWLRAMRGKRSQRALSRRLGYRTNIAYRWESGRCWPTARATMRAMKKLGWDLDAALAGFAGSDTAARRGDLATPAGIAQLLGQLRGPTTIVAIAAVTGHSRFSVARWMKGESEPRLPDFLRLIEACSLRLLDFVAAFFTPQQVPQVGQRLEQLAAIRRAAYDEPLSHAVLRALELASYRALPRHRSGWIASRIGIALEEEERCLRTLAGAGQIKLERRKWRTRDETVVDTRVDPEGTRRLKAYWGRRAIELLERGAEGQSALNLMSVSEADHERIRALTRSYFNDLRAIVAQSQPNERVLVFCAQLLPLDRADP
jgi:DNA-binding phage protein